MRWFEDITLGRVDWSPTTYLVTEEEIVDVGRRWDPQPFHTDPVAAEASIFGGLVAATAHLFAILEALGARVAEDDRIAAVRSLGLRNMRNHAPARPGDVIRRRGEVLDRRPADSEPGLGIVDLRGELFNQNDGLVFGVDFMTLVRCRRTAEG